MAGVFGGALALIIPLISPYTFLNWQWWAAFLLIITLVNIYRVVEGKAKTAMAFVFGFSLTWIFQEISTERFTILNWQWWATVLPLLIIGVIYAHTERPYSKISS